MGGIIFWYTYIIKPVKTLSIDGGGIYGVFSAIILSEIEKQTKKPISTLFDLIAGTSTGGIIALGLTTPDENNHPKFTALDTAGIYEKNSKDIFSRSFFHKVKALGNILGHKYSTKGIKKTFNNLFGDVSLTDSLTPLLITAYDIENRKPYFFKTAKALFEKDRDFYFRDIAAATSAAPTYFEPAHILNTPKTLGYTFIDGGVFANNPSMCAYVESKNLFPDQEIILISIGAEWFRQPYPFKKSKNWGALNWTLPLIDIFFDGEGDSVDYQLKTLFPQETNSQNSYFRLSALIGGEEESIQFDNGSSENIQKIKTVANAYIKGNPKLIESICKTLTS